MESKLKVGDVVGVCTYNDRTYYYRISEPGYPGELDDYADEEI